MDNLSQTKFWAADESVEAGLTALNKLFEDDSRWTQRAQARRHEPTEVPNTTGVRDPDAYCWCLAGGALLVSRSLPQRDEIVKELCLTLKPDILEQATTDGLSVIELVYGNEVVRFNDESGRKAEEIRDLIERTQARLAQPG
jgi:hypothetical protein